MAKSAEEGLPENQLKDIMTSELQNEIQDFLSPSSKQSDYVSPFQKFKSMLVTKTSVFDSFENRKIRRLLTYTNIQEQTRDNPNIRSSSFAFQAGFLAILLGTLIIPKKISTKMFLGLSCALSKNLFANNIETFQAIQIYLSDSPLNETSQQCRDIYEFYIHKKLAQDAQRQVSNISPQNKLLLENFLHKIEEDSKNYYEYKSREHLL